jgi:hypothetical protein
MRELVFDTISREVRAVYPDSPISTRGSGIDHSTGQVSGIGSVGITVYPITGERGRFAGIIRDVKYLKKNWATAFMEISKYTKSDLTSWLAKNSDLFTLKEITDARKQMEKLE